MAWYGGGERQAGVAAGTGHWYKAGEKLIPLTWTSVRDETGTHRDEYFYSTDPTMTAAAMIAAYHGRWDLETTFQEARRLLGLESTKGWCRRTVPEPPRACRGCTRSSPCCTSARPRQSDRVASSVRARRA
ncbi:hypothetical protein [Tautonia plasticadhaerens]|uniref:hypothetical protein n=1 Tax=Tautonia plasticadhaerens TaxID=2527974 RepID=UPI001E307ECD|nr:hypothetical protein [Tautonia plasticadhaerens]